MSHGSAASQHCAKGLVGTHGCREGMRCPTGPPTCMPLKRALMAVSSWLALLRTSSIMALRRTMASRVDVCSSFTACPGWRGGCGAAAASVPRPRAPRSPAPAYHHRLVQLLAALHVRRLDVDAVRPALPAGVGVRARPGRGTQGQEGAGTLTPACP